MPHWGFVGHFSSLTEDKALIFFRLIQMVLEDGCPDAEQCLPIRLVFHQASGLLGRQPSNSTTHSSGSSRTDCLLE